MSHVLNNLRACPQVILHRSPDKKNTITIYEVLALFLEKCVVLSRRCLLFRPQDFLWVKYMSLHEEKLSETSVERVWASPRKSSREMNA